MKRSKYDEGDVCTYCIRCTNGATNGSRPKFSCFLLTSHWSRSNHLKIQSKVPTELTVLISLVHISKSTISPKPPNPHPIETINTQSHTNPHLINNQFKPPKDTPQRPPRQKTLHRALPLPNTKLYYQKPNNYLKSRPSTTPARHLARTSLQQPTIHRTHQEPNID